MCSRWTLLNWSVNMDKNGKQEAEAHAAPSHTRDQRHVQTETLTLTGSLESQAASPCSCWHFWQLQLRSWLESRKSPQVPKLQHSVLLRGQTWQHHTKTPHTMVSQSLNKDSRVLCCVFCRSAQQSDKNTECSSPDDWLTDLIVKTCLQKVRL